MVQFTHPLLTPRRIAVTLGLLAIFAIGSFIPAPGVSTMTPTGPGARFRLSIFMIGVVPILSSLLIVELAKSIFPGIERWANAAPDNARWLGAGITGLSLAIAFYQGVNLAGALEAARGLVAEPGAAFRLTLSMTLVGATAVLCWFITLIDRRGIGSGFWILYLAPLFAMFIIGGGAGVRELLAMGEITLRDLAANATVATIAVVALLAVNRVRGPCDHEREIWSPLLGSYAAGLLLVAMALTLSHARDPLDDPFWAIGGATHLALVVLAVLAFAALRGRVGVNGEPGRAENANPRYWLVVVTQALVCAGAAWWTANTIMPFAINGVAIIATVAVASRFLVGERPSASSPA